MQSNSKQLVPLDLLDVLLRSWWTVVVGLCIGLTLTIVLIERLPRTYQSLVEVDAYDEEFSADFIRPTVANDTERHLSAIRQTLFFERDDVPGIVAGAIGEEGTDEDNTALLQSVNVRTRISMRPRARYFSIAVRDPNRYRAATIANTIADLFVEENSLLRAQLASQHTATLENLASQTEKDLAEVDQKIIDRKQNNPGMSERDYSKNLESLEEAELALVEIERDQIRLRDHLDLLEAEKAQAGLLGQQRTFSKSTRPSGTGGPLLAQKQLELQELLLRYSDNHPAVRRRKAEIERLQASSSDLPESETDEPASKPPLTPPTLDFLDVQVRVLQAQLNDLASRATKTRREIASLNARIEGTPEVEAELEKLYRRRKVLEGTLDQRHVEIAGATDAQRLEEAQQINKFRIVSPAFPSSTPVWPNPPMVAAVFVAVGVAVFVGPILGKWFFYPRIMSEAGLKSLSKVPVLVAIPEMPTPATTRRRRRYWIKNLLLSGTAAGMLGAALVLQRLGVI